MSNINIEKRPSQINSKVIFEPKILGDIFLCSFFIGAMLVKCFYFQYTTKVNMRPFNQPMNNNMLKASFATLLIITAFMFFVFNKRRRQMLLLVNVLLSFILISDTIYFRYYSNAVTIPVLLQIKLVGSIGQSIMSLFKIKDIVYVIDLPIMAAGIILLKKKTMFSLHIGARAIVSIIMLLLGLPIIHNTYHATENIKFAYDNNFVIQNMGIGYFHYHDIKRFVKDNYLENRILSVEEKQTLNYYFESKEDKTNQYKDVAKGKNLIVIQVEALQEFVINNSILGKEITPNINKLIKDSLYFSNYYHQVGGGNTSDAEFMTNTSLYPVREGAVNFRYPNNDYDALPKKLKEQGYDTYAFHGYKPSFWNRTVVYQNLGFDTFMSMDDYVMDDKVGWAISDSSFFRQSMNSIDTSKPFYGFFVTLSSHHPYDAFINYDFNVGDYEKTQLGNFIKSAHYVDKCIGELIENLKQQGVYEDTLIVIYGDHAALFEDQKDDVSNFLGFEYNDLNWGKIQKVPLIIHNPDVQAKMVDVTGGQVDLLPTIANMMGLDFPFAVGKDLLSTDRGYAILREGSVVTDEYFYVNKHDKVYSLKTGEVLPIEVYEEEVKAIETERNLSELIIKKDAIPKLSPLQ